MTSAEDKKMVELATLGLSNRQIAKELGVDESTVRRHLKEMGFQRHLVPEDLEERFAVHLDQPIMLEGDATVTADWHIPLYDPGYVNEMISVSRAAKMETLIIAGDFWNFDALSQYDPKQDEANLGREHKEGIAMMRVLLETFKRIIYVWGNHDARLHKALGFKIQFKEAMRLMFGELGQEALKSIEFTNLDHVWLQTEKGPWYICHPASYSRRPLTNTTRLAAKHNANIITAHSHHCAVGYAEDGKHVVAEIGGLFDVDKTAYLQRSTTFPRWQQGYALVKKGKLEVHSPGWTT